MNFLKIETTSSSRSIRLIQLRCQTLLMDLTPRIFPQPPPKVSSALSIWNLWTQVRLLDHRVLLGTQLGISGMSNNLPIYPLLRSGRDVDILIAFDASADIKSENWLSVADGYAKQRGIKGWPIGAGWPKEDASKDRTQAELDSAEAASPQQAAGKLADMRESRRQQGEAERDSEAELSYCNVWVGTTLERESEDEPPQSKRVNADADWKLMDPNAGIAVIYFPFLPNPKVEGVDPNTSDFMSTWNFVYTPEDIDKVVALARANFEEGKEQTKRTIRAVYERKKAKRLEKESKLRISKLNTQLRKAGDHFI